MIRIVIERPDQPAIVRSFPQEAVLIGRASESDWCLPFPDVSRQHCRFSRRGGEIFVEGLSERSPIYVNGRRVHGGVRITTHDVVRFGLCNARLGQAEEHPTAPPTRPAPAPAGIQMRSPPPPTSRAGSRRPERTAVAADAGEIVDAQPSSAVAVRAPLSTVTQASEGSVITTSSPQRGPSASAAPGGAPRDMSAIVARALRWRELDRPPSYLLRGAALRQGRQYLREGPMDLGEHGALVRQYVEISQAHARVEVRRRAFGGGLMVAAILGGFTAARALAGELVLPDTHGLRTLVSQGCQEELLARGQVLLDKAARAGDDKAALLVLLQAYKIAEQSRCAGAAAIEQELRARLAGQAGKVLGAHPAPVIAAAISPDQRYTASVDQDGRLYVWNPAKGRSPEPLETSAKAQKLAWSEDSRLLITGDEAGGVTIWKVDRSGVRLERELPGHRGPITAIAVSRSGELIATGDRRGEVRLWVVVGASIGQLVGRDEGRMGAVLGLVFDASSKRLFNRAGGGLGVWGLAGSGTKRLGKLERLPTDHEVTSVDVSRDGDQILVGDASGQVLLWSVRSAKITAPTLIHSGMERIVQVAFVPGRKHALIATGERNLFLVNYGAKVRADDKYETRRFKGTGGVVEHLIVDSSGSRALTVHAGGRELWNLAEAEEEPMIRLDVGGAAWRSVTENPRHSLIVAGGEDGRVVHWDLLAGVGSGGAHVLTSSGQAVDAIALAPDGALLASGGRDGIVRWWTIDEAAVTLYKTCEIKAPIDRLALHNRRIAVAAQQRAFVCDESAERPAPVELEGTYDALSQLAFSGDGQWLVAADRGGTILGWEVGARAVRARPSLVYAVGGKVVSMAVSREHVAVATAEEVAGSILLGPLSANPSEGDAAMRSLDRELPWTTVVFHPEGRVLAAGARHDVHVWTLGSSEEPRRMALSSSVSALSFLAGDDVKLAAGGEAGDVRVFDVMTDKKMSLKGQGGPIIALSFASPDVLIAAADNLLYKHYLSGDTREVVKLIGHPGPISGLAVASKHAATASLDGNVWVWPLREAGLRRLVCQRVGRDLSPAEWEEYVGGERQALCAGEAG